MCILYAVLKRGNLIFVLQRRAFFHHEYRVRVAIRLEVGFGIRVRSGVGSMVEFRNLACVSHHC